MKIFIAAKPNSKKEYVKKTGSFHFLVSVHERAIGGRANRAIIASLSEYFHKPKSQIVIISGLTSKNKIFEVPLTTPELDDLEPQKKLF